MPSTKRQNRKAANQKDAELEKTKSAFLEDFQKQLDKRMEDIEKRMESIIEKASNNFRMYSMSVPKRIRDMTDKDFFYAEQEKENDANSVEEALKIKKAIEQSIDAEVKGIKSTRKKATVRSMKTPMTANKGAKSMAVSSTALRRSTRKRNNVMNNTDFVTPLNRAGRTSKRGPMATPLPMITPKIDLQTPLDQTVRREAKMNETLFSMDGSPVAPVITTTVKKGRGRKKEKDLWRVSLAGGKAMMIPMNKDVSDCPLELEEADKLKLMTMRSKLDSLLNMGK